jgi:hypothetical protein
MNPWFLLQSLCLLVLFSGISYVFICPFTSMNSLYVLWVSASKWIWKFEVGVFTSLWTSPLAPCSVFWMWTMSTTSIMYFPKKIQQYEKVQFGQGLVKIQLGSLRSASLWFPHTYTSCENVFTFKNWIHSTFGPLSQFDLEKNLVFSFIPKRTICCPLGRKLVTHSS